MSDKYTYEGFFIGKYKLKIRLSFFSHHTGKIKDK